VKIVDLSHLMNMHTPGWVGYADNQMYYRPDTVDRLARSKLIAPGGAVLAVRIPRAAAL
jgi:hypothetical protein